MRGILRIEIAVDVQRKNRLLSKKSGVFSHAFRLGTPFLVFLGRFYGGQNVEFIRKIIVYMTNSYKEGESLKIKGIGAPFFRKRLGLLSRGAFFVFPLSTPLPLDYLPAGKE